LADIAFWIIGKQRPRTDPASARPNGCLPSGRFSVQRLPSKSDGGPSLLLVNPIRRVSQEVVHSGHGRRSEITPVAKRLMVELSI